MLLDPSKQSGGSALAGLTAVFGMGTGVTQSLEAPRCYNDVYFPTTALTGENQKMRPMKAVTMRIVRVKTTAGVCETFDMSKILGVGRIQLYKEGSISASPEEPRW